LKAQPAHASVPSPMVATAARFAGSWAARFLAVQGVDRAMALAAQAFSALIPLLIVYSALVSRGDGNHFADQVIERFELEGATARTVQQAFTSSQTVEDSISLLGLLLLIVSALSFTRGLQRLYEGAFGLPSLGMRNTKWGLLWLGVLVLYTSVRPPLARLFDAEAFEISASLALAAVAWMITPYLLLGRRLELRPLIPVALMSAIGMTALAASSVIWLPRTLASSAEQFGLIGVAFSMLAWLVAAAFVLVAAATGGAVASEWRAGDGGYSSSDSPGTSTRTSTSEASSAT
jgi:membrane protein